MAKEGSVAPKERINVTFKPSTGGAQEEIELPLKLLAIGDYTHRKDERKVEDRKPISIDKMTFDEVLAKQELELILSVPNRLQEEGDTEELAVKVRVSSMKDFNPASLVEQVSANWSTCIYQVSRSNLCLWPRDRLRSIPTKPISFSSSVPKTWRNSKAPAVSRSMCPANSPSLS